MPVTCIGQDRTLRAAVSGEVDHHGARDIMAELYRQIDQVLPRELTLDLGGVSFMDSSGIALLLGARRRLGELGGALQVVNVPAQSARVLRAAGIDHIISWEE